MTFSLDMSTKKTLQPHQSIATMENFLFLTGKEMEGFEGGEKCKTWQAKKLGQLYNYCTGRPNTKNEKMQHWYS